jgi:hypothetical protein
MKKNVPQVAIMLGLIVLFLSVVWWQQTFGIKLGYVQCFAVSGGACSVGPLVKIFGGSGYNPVFFWVGLTSLVSGLVLRKAKLM